MKVYKIKVNGKSYEVEIESITEVETKQFVSEPKKESESEIKIEAPMQGEIIKSNVLVGTRISKGDVLMVLESMKLENDILAPTSGYVRQVLVTTGEKVEINQLLLVIG